MTVGAARRRHSPARPDMFQNLPGRLCRSPRSFILALFACLAFTPVQAADSLTAIREMLAKEALICAEFTQSKQMRALTRPLVSTGRLIFVARKGVLWQVRHPFATRILIKQDALIKWNDDGAAERISFGQAPIFRALSQVFLAVFDGDIEPLRESFKIDSDVTGSLWRLTLVPLDSRFAAIIATIRVSGGRYVEELLIQEGRGDRTLIRFAGAGTGPCRLREEEKNYFAQ